MKNVIIFSVSACVIFLNIVAVSVAARQYGTCSVLHGACESNSFKCLDGNCIARSHYCNGEYDCPDRSDEDYCRPSGSGYCKPKFIRCGSDWKCIPEEWKCDGKRDCPGTSDEYYCGSTSTKSPPLADSTLDKSSFEVMRRKANEWLKKKIAPESPTRKWGPLVHKSAVALYLSDPDFASDSSSVRKEMTYELSIQLLSRIAKKKIQSVSSGDLASFLNAFLVTCIDPRDFHGFNLVQELRSRLDKQNYTNPYVLLALCNAGDIITDSDVKKLVEVFWSNNREIWTDVQAIALMALACARNQTESTVDEETITELALELKQHQSRNGTVENLHTTLLVMQALYAAEPDEDPDNFDEKKALSYIIQNQQSDGSFGNFLLTYYALLVLNCRSLVNISSSHCKPVQKDEDTVIFDLVNHVGPKMRVQYSLWIGLERDIERTLTLRVPTNTSFYGVMEIAAEIDSRYKFDYVVKQRKPYITAVSEILDDSECEQFWFPYIIKEEKPSLLLKSTADVTPGNDDHIIMWYRKGNWSE